MRQWYRRSCFWCCREGKWDQRETFRYVLSCRQSSTWFRTCGLHFAIFISFPLLQNVTDYLCAPPIVFCSQSSQDSKVFAAIERNRMPLRRSDRYGTNTTVETRAMPRLSSSMHSSLHSPRFTFQSNAMEAITQACKSWYSTFIPPTLYTAFLPQCDADCYTAVERRCLAQRRITISFYWAPKLLSWRSSHEAPRRAANPQSILQSSATTSDLHHISARRNTSEKSCKAGCEAFWGGSQAYNKHLISVVTTGYPLPLLQKVMYLSTRMSIALLAPSLSADQPSLLTTIQKKIRRAQ